MSYIFSGKLLDEFNREESSFSSVTWILTWYSILLFASSLCAFVERYLLSYFAGKGQLGR